MSNKYKILIVEDEANICTFVKTVLEANSYKVLDARNGSVGKAMYLSHNPDLIILDLGLPDIDGTGLIKEIRRESNIPIIVLSARNYENDKVEALDLGANDYVTKPFGTEELLARVRAALRNNRTAGSDKAVIEKMHIKDMLINCEARQIFIENAEIKLTQTEYNIVELLAIHSGRVMTYTEIVKKIWGYSDSGSIKKLQVNMANIRKKLGEKPGENKYIQNELGVGYRMATDNSI